MKKLLTLTAVVAILATPATAVQKCVAFEYQESARDSNYNGDAWYVEYDNVALKGTSILSASKGQNAFEDRPNVELRSTVSDNKYCWCRVLEPFVSNWVYMDMQVITSDYVNRCASLCSTIFSDNNELALTARAALIIPWNQEF